MAALTSAAAPDDRLRLAVPNKGRLCQPAVSLLREAGFTFEEDERRLFVPCENFPLDLLFLRADDIGEYVQDGVVDLGITGSNLLLEAGVDVTRIEPLGFGRCRLQLAAPRDSGITGAEDLRGRVVATSHPKVSSRFFLERGVEVRLIEITGAVEVTPLLGVADAVVDLVASGSTLATNGLVALDAILDSQAELVRTRELRPARHHLAGQVALMLTSVIRARHRKYLMMNAPAEAVDRIKKVVPGMRSPSVIHLTDPGMVAIHTVVDADTVWQQLGPLQAAGASSILVLPIEKLIP